ncbi:uncharacterized protein LOC134271427, partial [Saccostrea cucullata]|uniref:uncharacterized protein LOC134271427 n=1 Tax=Saccostrea cuccullata TaxID=36930 RepID=UPI002ED0B5F6
MSGYFGRNCTSRCSYPKFGKKCRQICNCSQSDCNPEHGCRMLSEDCDLGFTGSYCELPCRYPSYGYLCQEFCTCEEKFCNSSTGCEVGSPKFEPASQLATKISTNTILSSTTIVDVVEENRHGCQNSTNIHYWNTNKKRNLLVFGITFFMSLSILMMLSSEYGAIEYAIFHASYAVECGIAECVTGRDNDVNLACTKNQTNPWLKVSLSKTSTMERVLIYNRQDCCGERLHEVRVDVIDNGRNVSCGFYQGPAANGDRILVLCERETRGNEVIISILSKDGPTDFLS